MNATRELAVTAFIFIAAGLAAKLPGAPPSPPEQDRKASLAALTKIATSYQVKLDAKRSAKLHEEPVFRWNNSVSDIQDAALYIWLLDGRPVAAGSFLWQARAGRYHEFQSLALEPLRAERNAEVAWEPAQAGITFIAVPDAPHPADTSNKRLVQMQSLAERFRLEATKGPPFYGENSVYQFRLIRKPLLRYGDSKRVELEGAIFAFVQGTDPEVLLILENRAHGKETGWEFALAQMTGWPVKGWYDELEVWSIERRHPAADPTKPYFVAGPFPDTRD